MKCHSQIAHAIDGSCIKCHSEVGHR
jgi:hypothetical protein